MSVYASSSDPARVDIYNRRLDAARSWIAHWMPRRHSHESARNAARWAIGNAKFCRWMLGGRYPSGVNGR